MTEENKVTRVKMIPTWECAVQIYMSVLENPNANEEGKQSARLEILRLTKAFDQMNQEKESNS